MTPEKQQMIQDKATAVSEAMREKLTEVATEHDVTIIVQEFHVLSNEFSMRKRNGLVARTVAGLLGLLPPGFSYGVIAAANRGIKPDPIRIRKAGRQ